MDVRIDELHSTVEAVDGAALLSPQMLEAIVRAVLAAMANGHRTEEARRSDLDTRSVVERQREGER
jgi:hypothetical protein